MSAFTEFPKLKIFNNNSKIGRDVFTFAIPAGWTCPGAHLCRTRVEKDPSSRHVIDGPNQEHRCYAASLEAAFGSVHAAHWHNNRLLHEAGTTTAMRDLILSSIPPKAKKLRIHDSGDFFNIAYFDAWLAVTHARPDMFFYAYTKSLPFWVGRREVMPSNLLLTASRGGKYDHMIGEFGLREVVVVLHPEEAAALGLDIDHDDSHAQNPNVANFALLIHGAQKQGSDAAVAVKRLKDEDIKYSYGRTAKKQEQHVGIHADGSRRAV